MPSVLQLPIENDWCVDKLQDESWCTSYAYKIRWPEGFSCPACGFHQKDSLPEENSVCRHCGRTTSITASTLLHGSKKELSLWLQAAWWASGERSSLSIKQLQHCLDLNSYQTAWSWMKKLRQAIQMMNRKQCRGIVLIDSQTVDCLSESNLLLAAVESIAGGRTTGRLRLEFCQSLDAETIELFCERAVLPGSVIDAPHRQPFTSVLLPDMLYTSNKTIAAHETILDICSTYRRWCRQQKYRLSRFKSYQDALEEFCFFHNGELHLSRSWRFAELVAALLTPHPNPMGSRVSYSTDNAAR